MILGSKLGSSTRDSYPPFYSYIYIVDRLIYMLVYLFVINNSRKKSWFLSILFAEYCGLTGQASCAEEEIVQETSDPDGGHRNEATIPNTASIILIMA